MTATLTLAHRLGAVTVRDTDTVRAIAEAVADFNAGRADRQFRVTRASPSRHIRRSVVFNASDVETLNADGINLVDLGSPFGQDEQVAA